MNTRTPLRMFPRSPTIARFIRSAHLREQPRVPQQSYKRSYSTPISESSPPAARPLPPRPVDLRSQFSTPLPPPPPPPSSKRKRNLRPYIYAVGFTFCGLMVGQYMSLVISPPPLPLPGSDEDKLMVEYLTKAAERLPIVKTLMEDPVWEHHEAYEGSTVESKHRHLMAGALAGARGIGGFQRIFYNQATGECICVVHIGGAVAGWPGVTHGGLIASILDEVLGRAAILQLPARTGVTANLQLKYLKPVVTNDFYVIRSAPEKEGATPTKQWVSGRLERMDGGVCTEARALFVVPKNLKTQRLESF